MHMLKQRESGRLFFPERELLNRPDMIHVDAEEVKGPRGKREGFKVVGPWKGEIEAPRAKIDVKKATKRALIKYAANELGEIIDPSLPIDEVRDIVQEALNRGK